MAVVWKPAIWDGSALTRLPRPVTKLTGRADWDFRESKVPLSDGKSSTGHSSNGTEIFVQGQFGHNGEDTLLLTDLTMMAKLAEMNTVLDVGSDAEKYEFFSFYDSDSTTYYKWTPCSTREYTWDIGDDNHKMYEYTIRIYCENVFIRTTGPGS